MNVGEKLPKFNNTYLLDCTATELKKLKAWLAENCQDYWMIGNMKQSLGVAPSKPSPLSKPFEPPHVEINQTTVSFACEGDETLFLLKHAGTGTRRRARKAS